MVLFGLRNLGCAFLRPCHFSLLRILGWRNSKFAVASVSASASWWSAVVQI